MPELSRYDPRASTLAWPAILVLLTASATGLAQQNTDLPKLPTRHRTVDNVITMPAGRTMGSSNAVNVDSKGTIWLFERCGVNSCVDSTLDPILQFDPSGKFLRSFGAGLFVFPHAIIIDRDDNLWVVDAGVVENRQGEPDLQVFADGQASAYPWQGRRPRNGLRLVQRAL